MTSRPDILSELNATSARRAWALDGHEWHDLPAPSTEFTLAVWTAHANHSGVAQATVERVSELLAANDCDLHPGQLRQLARLPQSELSRAAVSWSQLRQAASPDAAELAMSVTGVRRHVLGVMALLTSTGSGPRDIDLAFVLASHNKMPGVRPEWLGSVLVADGETPAVEPPTYSEAWTLSVDVAAEVGELARRGWIERVGERWSFAHSTYLEASRECLADVARADAHTFASLARRAAFSLDPISATHAVDAVWCLMEDRVGAAELLSEVVRKSVFPRAESRALALLATAFVDLPDAVRSEFLASLAGHDTPIAWHLGEPWYSSVRNVPLLDGRTQSRRLDDARRRLSDGHVLRPVDCWALIEEHDTDDAVDTAVLQQALVSSIGLVRSAAARATLSQGGVRDADEGRRLLDDEDPNVVAAAVHGLILSWDELDQSLRDELLAHVRDVLARPPVAALVARLVLRFRKLSGWDEQWYEGETAPWDLWSELMVATIPLAPQPDLVRGADLFHIAQQAVLEVNTELALRVVGAWLDWAEPLAANGALDDWTLGGADLLMRVPGTTPEQRAPAIYRLLGATATALRAQVASDLLDHWTSLEDAERVALLEFVAADRADRRVIRGRVLAMGRMDDRIDVAISGAVLPWDDQPQSVAETWDPELLRDALSAFLATRNPLTIPRDRSDFWFPVFRCLATDPGHACFAKAVEWVMFMDPVVETRAAVCRSARDWGQEARQCLFETLLSATCVGVHSGLRACWRIVIESTTAGEYEAWSHRLGEAAESISDRRDLPLIDCVDSRGNNMLEDVLREFPVDHMLCLLIHKWRQLGLRDRGQDLIDAIRRVYNVRPPRLLITHERVRDLLGELAESDQGLELQVRGEIGETLRRSGVFRHSIRPPLEWEGWVPQPRERRNAE